MTQRKIIVNIATSADGFVACRDGSLDWLTDRQAPKGFYGLPEFERSTDTRILGRRTFDRSLELGARFKDASAYYVFSRQPPPSSLPARVEFVSEPVAAFANRLREGAGKDIWLMGGGDVISSFLDAGAIDELIITVMPVFIGDGIPLLRPARRNVALHLLGVTSFPDGVIQVHYQTDPSRPSRPS